MCALFNICLLLFVSDAISAPTENNIETTTENFDSKTEKNEELEDSSQTDQQKNPIQQWFESLAKNATTGTHNAFNTIRDLVTNLSNNANSAGTSNLPVMYMGSFQLVKMPMPGISDVIKGMGDLATMAQTVNKVMGGGGLPIPGLQLLQG